MVTDSLEDLAVRAAEGGAGRMKRGRAPAHTALLCSYFLLRRPLASRATRPAPISASASSSGIGVGAAAAKAGEERMDSTAMESRVRMVDAWNGLLDGFERSGMRVGSPQQRSCQWLKVEDLRKKKQFFGM